MTLQEVIEKTTDFSSSVTKRLGCIEMYYKYSSKLSEGEIVVDFGTGTAGTALVIALTNPNVIIYTFDIGLYENHKILDHDYVYTITKRLQEKNAKNVIFMLGHSLTIYPQWDKKIAILNIDGNHEYENTKKELSRWEPFLKHNGYLMMHDYNSKKRFPGLKKAVNELVNDPKRYNFLEEKGYTSVWQKL